jgi:uncharacterized protein
MAVEFEWDPEKARLNIAKHGVTFEDARFAVLDPFSLEIVDDRFDYGEERLRIIGASSGNILFVVTTSYVEDHYRIISARRATRAEKVEYHGGAR